jgi:hypothetical protein
MNFQNTINVKGLLVFVMQVAIETKFSTPRLHALAVAVIIIFTAAD